MRSNISMALEALGCVWMHEGVDGSDPMGFLYCFGLLILYRIQWDND
jgi:hypothetical protein